jgi:enoyl-CoA hydratase/carnithine racemase
MTGYKCLLYEHHDGIATLTLNRPDRLNALGDTLRDDLQDAVMRASEDAEVRVIVVTGAGKGFCAGGDVKAMHEGRERGAQRALVERVAPGRDRTVLALRDAPKPVLAAVNGAAAGAGMNLALACDIRIASTTAKFSQAFVKRGLHPDWGGTYFLPRLVGMAKAAELIWTGEIIDAQEALRLGIVSAVHPPEELMPVVYALASKIAAGPPIAIRLAKRALYHNLECDLRQALEFETFAQNICYDTEDAREGIRAFVEKRPPSFRGM